LESREKWFINTTNCHIPNEVVGLLQLGEGFCIPPDNKSNLIAEYIKHIENGFLRVERRLSCVNTMRSQFINFLKPIHKLDHHMSDTDLEITSAVCYTKKFVKNNLNILFTRADKGNTVVALNRNEYE